MLKEETKTTKDHRLPVAAQTERVKVMGSKTWVRHLVESWQNECNIFGKSIFNLFVADR
jgi:glycerol-3-phosphate cytidylyltransferase-like family protein